jgi:hypothetical protein
MYREIKEDELRLDKTLGYIYFLDKKHPLARGTAYSVYYHRHVASVKEGKWLSSEEVVHHIDGNKQNNKPENLQVMTSTEHGKLHGNSSLVDILCKHCNTPFSQKDRKQKFCSVPCAVKYSTKLDGLTKEELEYLIWTQPYTSLAKQFNCSDNGIRKWARRLQCTMPPSMFHNKFISIEDKLKEYSKYKVS